MAYLVPVPTIRAEKEQNLCHSSNAHLAKSHPLVFTADVSVFRAHLLRSPRCSKNAVSVFYAVKNSPMGLFLHIAIKGGIRAVSGFPSRSQLDISMKIPRREYTSCVDRRITKWLFEADLTGDSDIVRRWWLDVVLPNGQWLEEDLRNFPLMPAKNRL